jgi:ATP-dependent helicase IRC3
VIARPTKSSNVFSQMVGRHSETFFFNSNGKQLGRGLRLSKETGKSNCYVIDFVENTSRVSDVVSLPTLLGLAPDILEGDTQISDELLGLSHVR